MKVIAKFLGGEEYLRCLKWSLMMVVVFWVLVYKFSQTQSQVPEFVYANF